MRVLHSRDPTPAVMAFDAVRGKGSVTLYFDVRGISSDDLEVSVERLPDDQPMTTSPL